MQQYKPCGRNAVRNSIVEFQTNIELKHTFSVHLLLFIVKSTIDIYIVAKEEAA